MYLSKETIKFFFLIKVFPVKTIKGKGLIVFLRNQIRGLLKKSKHYYSIILSFNHFS
jgi:hypothetical protein